MPLDRASAQRADPAWVARQRAASDARAVAAGRDTVLLDGVGDALLRGPVDGSPILLGLEDGAPLFAVDLEPGGIEGRVVAREAGEMLPQAEGRIEGRVITLREAGAMLPQAEGGLAAYAVALLNWHRRHRFCANCGTATEVAEGGYSRSCPHCGATHFPRTDPVVIMLVEHEGRVLLGRRAGWPGRRFSVLAGFVAPGESVEEAVVREVREESAIEAFEPRFVASQPWPFPASLMLGFNARAAGGEPTARDGELEEVAWFTREEVQAAACEEVRTAAREEVQTAAREEVQTADRDEVQTAAREESDFALPPSVSIARFLIDAWLRR